MQVLRDTQSHTPHTPREPPADDSTVKARLPTRNRPDHRPKTFRPQHITDHLHPEQDTHRPWHCQGLRAAWRTDVPTYEDSPRFTTDHHRLTPEQRRRFRQAVAAFVDDLRTGRFRAGFE